MSQQDNMCQGCIHQDTVRCVVCYNHNQHKARIIDEDKPDESKPVTQEDMNHLWWILERMVTVHGENRNVDYMKRFGRILNKIENG